ncbi:MAG: hypothetical protein QW379_02240 [Thermoplasmata archaeon]
MLSALLGLGLALLVLWLVLRRYEGAFNERCVFIGITVGLMLGLLSFLFHGFLDIVLFPPSVSGFLVYVVGFAVLDTMMIFVVLNSKWVRGQNDAAFTGAAVGAGFSASGVMGLTYAATSPAGGLTPIGLLSLTGIALSSTLFRISAGAILGIGSATSTPWHGAAKAFLAQIPFGTLFMLVYYAGIYFEMWLWVPVVLLMLGYTGWLSRFVIRVYLSESLPGDVKRALRRQRRRR